MVVIDEVGFVELMIVVVVNLVGFVDDVVIELVVVLFVELFIDWWVIWGWLYEELLVVFDGCKLVWFGLLMSVVLMVIVWLMEIWVYGLDVVDVLGVILFVI